jgi:hypothetical protein
VGEFYYPMPIKSMFVNCPISNFKLEKFDKFEKLFTNIFGGLSGPQMELFNENERR